MLTKLFEGSQDELFKEFSKGRTPKQLSGGELTDVQAKLAYPSMMPQDFDGNIEAWLLRIALWGDISIKHNHPEEKLKGVNISTVDFLNIMDDDENKNKFGLWNLEQLAVNKVLFYRKYVSYDGKNYKEEFIVEVKLKSSLQQSLDNAKKKGIFGWFR
jgi:hypothetical protein